MHKEFERFSKYLGSIKTSVFFGGLSIKKDKEVLHSSCPNVVVGTPGRILALVRDEALKLGNVKHFIIDECDKILAQLGKAKMAVNTIQNGHVFIPTISDMRRDVQEVFRATPYQKQVMMFSATLPNGIRPVCKKYMNNVGV